MKIKIFVDADDTILNSSEEVINILNEKHHLNPKKTYADLKDWGYKSIYGGMNRKEVTKIYDSDEFFDNVRIKEDFLEVYENYKNYFDFVIVSKGTLVNLQKKKKYFKDHLPEIEFIGITRHGEWDEYDKSNIDMRHGIQIDDRIDCMAGTNSPCKILYRNYRDFPWNNFINNPTENLYVVNTWKEISEYLSFTKKNPEWMYL